MSRDAGANVDRGVAVVGLNFSQGPFSIGAIDYYSDDIINIFTPRPKPSSSRRKISVCCLPPSTRSKKYGG